MFYVLSLALIIASLAGLWLTIRVSKRRTLALEQKKVDAAYEELVRVLDPTSTRAAAKGFHTDLPGAIDRIDGSLREDAKPEIVV